MLFNLKPTSIISYTIFIKEDTAKSAQCVSFKGIVEINCESLVVPSVFDTNVTNEVCT